MGGVIFLEKDFVLCQGVSVDGADKLASYIVKEKDGFTGSLSAELIAGAVEAFLKSVPEPVFFFLELPEDVDDYAVYYLDNCTREVAFAVMERFGELLVQDGVSRFGFGSNKTGDELYIKDYQEFMLYTENPGLYEKALEKLGAEFVDDRAEAVFPGDLISKKNEGTLTVVELNGETVFDIPEALEEAGMYRSES